MEALTLVLDKPNTVVTMKNKALWITREQQEPLSVPLGCLGTVLVIGKPMVSCDVWRALAEVNVAACLFPGRGNQPPAMLGAGLSAGLEKRRRQYAVYGESSLRLTVAKAIVSRKLMAYQDALMTLESLANCPLQINTEHKATFLAHVSQAHQRLDSVDDMSRLLGTEGAASRAWFSLLQHSVDEQWSFTGRNRRPPKDPLNTLLSLTYAMIVTKAQQAAHASGLDPQLGFLHVPRSGRPALALDIIEPVRPLADVFAIATLSVMQPSDFTIDEQSGCTMLKEAKRRYFSAWSGQQYHWLSLEENENFESETGEATPTRPLHNVLRQWVNAINLDIETQYDNFQQQHVSEMNDEYAA